MIKYLKKKKGFTPLILKDTEDIVLEVEYHDLEYPSRYDWFNLISYYIIKSARNYVHYTDITTSNRAKIKFYECFYGGMVINNELIVLVGENDEEEKMVLVDKEFFDNFNSYFKEIIKHLKPLGITKKDVYFMSKEELTREFCTNYSVSFNDFSKDSKDSIVKEFLEYGKASV